VEGINGKLFSAFLAVNSLAHYMNMDATLNAAKNLQESRNYKGDS